jgi:hypothetical protein
VTTILELPPDVRGPFVMAEERCHPTATEGSHESTFRFIEGTSPAT